MSGIYLDNNATTQVAPEVLAAMLPYFTENYGNPSSLHHHGIQAETAIKQARYRLAYQLNAISLDELIFTSGGTESNHLAIQGVAYAYRHLGQHIITTPTEHKSVLICCEQLKKQGYQIDYAAVDQFGCVIPESIHSLIRNDTILIAVIHANNELGTINPINHIAKQIKAKNPNIIFFADGVQAFSKIQIDLTNIDLYSISGHKFHGPKGIGALAKKNNIKLQPIFSGQQEFGLRAGTENIPGIIGLAAASELAYQNFLKTSQHISTLKNKLISGLKQINHCVINSPADGLDNTINVSFLGVPAEILLHALNEENIFISSGSACTSNSRKPSHVLQAINLSTHRMKSAVRFSFSRYTTGDEIDFTIQKITLIVNKLRSLIK